jgi:chaperonin cofactor prefoldin
LFKLRDHIEKEKNAVSQLKKECEELDVRNNGLEEKLKIQNEELSSLNNTINDLSKNIVIQP